MSSSHTATCRHTTRRNKLVVAGLTALSVTALGIGAGAPAASAARAPKPSPTTTVAPTTTTAAPSTTTVVTPTSASVVIIKANSQPYQFTDSFYLQVTPFTQLGDAELLSGPTGANPVTVFKSDNGRVSFFNAVVDGTYSFRYRNKVWNASTATFTVSPWVVFSFRAPN